MKKTVSVIITTYNAEKTLERSLLSVRNQQGRGTDFDVEIIVVDDCSTDKSPEIAKSLGAIVLQTEKNTGGPNTGRNIGLKAASGDYICIMDHDDEWKENKLVVQLPFLEQVPIVSSGYSLVDTAKDKTIARVLSDPKGYIYYQKNQSFLEKLSKSGKGQQAYLGSLIYRKELKNILFEENFGMVDYDWVLRLFHNQDSIEVCESLYNRHVKDSNLSLNADYRMKDFYYSLLTIESYKNTYPKEVKRAYKKIHGSRGRYYYLLGDMKEARFYFARSTWNIKTILYYLTSFWGSKFVKKRFHTFG